MINTVNLLGITYNENIICNLIVGLINNSFNFKIPFMKNILEIKNPEDYKVEAETLISTSGGVPDIVVISENDNKVIISIVESKLKANNGHVQTIVYSEHVCIDEILCDREISSEKEIEIKYVYLNLIPDNDHVSDKYICKTYYDLVEEVWVTIEDEGLDRIYKDFCNEMINFYRGLKMESEDKLLNFLFNSEEREKRFIKYREIMLSIKCPNNLKIDYFGKLMGKEKEGFITKIMKNEWIGKEAKWLNGVYNINADNYDIHLELTFDILLKEVKICLHYESSPYVTRDRLAKWSFAEGREAFEKRRNEFKNILYKKIDLLDTCNYQRRDGVNTIAFINIPISDNATIKEFKEVITESLRCISKIVDETFNEV